MCARHSAYVCVCVCVILRLGARQGMRVSCGSKGERGDRQQLLVYGSRWQLMEIIRRNVNKQTGAFVFGMSSFLWHAAATAAAAQQFAIKYIYSHPLGMVYAIKCETLLAYRSQISEAAISVAALSHDNRLNVSLSLCNRFLKNCSRIARK